MDICKYLVVVLVDLAEILLLVVQVLVVKVGMVDYLLAEVVEEVTHMAGLLVVLAAMAVTVWFVFILGNQL
jgi:hypothetical protein